MAQNLTNLYFLMIILIFLFYLFFLFFYQIKFEKNYQKSPKKLVAIEQVLEENSDEGLLIHTDLDELAMSCANFEKELENYENNMRSRSSIPIFQDRVKKSIPSCKGEIRSVLPRFKILAHDL